ncbi:hypothetical protein DM02DRAFT_628303 [Periconia macrospinosa]|uniref:Uncharacterized protein n=1 Tax=Periconia macrospinosa TaxID=97972 RepID=A0A2V1DRH2_9PLEO|nr:hypothetical protein DM02DRAFT_628303 [Periconia macrospinosa]
MNIFSNPVIGSEYARSIVKSEHPQMDAKEGFSSSLLARENLQGSADDVRALPPRFNGGLRTPEPGTDRSRTSTPGGTPCPPEQTSALGAPYARRQHGRKARYIRSEGERASATTRLNFRIHEDSSDSIQRYPSPLSLRNASSVDPIASDSSDTQQTLRRQTKHKRRPEPTNKNRKNVSFAIQPTDAGDSSETTNQRESGRPFNEVSLHARYEDNEQRRAKKYKADTISEDECRLSSLHRSNRNSAPPVEWGLPRYNRNYYNHLTPQPSTPSTQQPQSAAPQPPASLVATQRSEPATVSTPSPVFPINSPEEDVDSDPLEFGDPLDLGSTPNARHSSLYPIGKTADSPHLPGRKRLTIPTDRFSPSASINEQQASSHSNTRKHDPFPNIPQYVQSTEEEIAGRLQIEPFGRAQAQPYQFMFTRPGVRMSEALG